ncbi:MAG: hypothetical protein ACK5N8_06715 [Alphaproteobacteria bacterium]
MADEQLMVGKGAEHQTRCLVDKFNSYQPTIFHIKKNPKKGFQLPVLFEFSKLLKKSVMYLIGGENV